MKINNKGIVGVSGIVSLVILVGIVLWLIIEIVVAITATDDSGQSGEFVCINGESSNVYISINNDVPEGAAPSDPKEYTIEEYVKCLLPSEFVITDNSQYLKAAAITLRTSILNKFDDTASSEMIDGTEILNFDVYSGSSLYDVDCAAFTGLTNEKKQAIVTAVDETAGVVMYDDNANENKLLDVKYDICMLDAELPIIGNTSGKTVSSLCNKYNYTKLKKHYSSELTLMNEYLNGSKSPTNSSGLDQYGALHLAANLNMDYQTILDYYFEGTTSQLDMWLTDNGVTPGSVDYGPSICGLGDDYPIITQCNPLWASFVFYTRPNGDRGTVCTGGCGPTSATIVLAGLYPPAGITTPTQMIKAANWWSINGNMDANLRAASNGQIGAHAYKSASLVEQNGEYLLVEHVSGQVLNRDFPQMPMILLVSSSNALSSGAAVRVDEDTVVDNGVCEGERFTNKGHFIVIVGIDEEGEVVVRDPGASARNYKTYSLRCINSWVSTWYPVYVVKNEEK